MDFLTESNMWLLYLGLFIAPFVQEDSAVIGAASLSVTRPDDWLPIFAVILAGLITSDSWKYWLGWAAKHHVWARKYGEKERVLKLKSAVLGNSVKTLDRRALPPLRTHPYLSSHRFFWRPVYKILALHRIFRLSLCHGNFLRVPCVGRDYGREIKNLYAICCRWHSCYLS